MYRLAYRLTGNRPDAEDLTQDVFVRVFRSLHRFQPGTFEGWLHRITTNLFLDSARRRQKIRFDGLADGSAERLPSAWPGPSEQLADADLDHDVAAALAALTPEFRAAVVLCDIEGLSYEEISAVLDVKIGTVRSRIHRGRAQLRAALDHRRPTGRRNRYLGVEVEGADRGARGRPRQPEFGAGEAVVRKAPCAELAELRSAYVDGALSNADREKLLAHLVGCAECRDEVADLRAVRDLLSRAAGRGRADGARPVRAAGLHRRHRSDRAAVDPSVPPRSGWSKCCAAEPIGVRGGSGLPQRRRDHRAWCVVVGVLGYAAAPSTRLAVVGDQTGRAQAAFSSSLGQLPLSSDTLGAVMLADVTKLAAAPAALDPGPSQAFGALLSAAEARQAMQRAAESEHTVSYSGRQAFFATRGDRTIRAVIEVDARTGQGSQIEVLSLTGQQLLRGFTPAALSSRVVDDELLALLERNYTLTGTQGATVAGRSATVVAAWRSGEPAARWWLDDETGIVLWQELYGRTGAVDLSVGFTSVSVSPTSEIMDHLPPRLVTPTITTSLSVSSGTGLTATGWSCPRDLSGHVLGAGAHRPGGRPDRCSTWSTAMASPPSGSSSSGADSSSRRGLALGRGSAGVRPPRAFAGGDLAVRRSGVHRGHRRTGRRPHPGGRLAAARPGRAADYA